MTRTPMLNCAVAFATGLAMSVAMAASDDASIARGRYLTRISGCNDCHTANYAESGGNIADAEQLTGVAVGFRGPWGTTYPANLRLIAQSMDEDAWLVYARLQRRPPMPWFALRDMSDDDVRAIYRYVRSLGPRGTKTPDYAPPGVAVSTAWISFEPQNLPAAARPAH